MAVEEALKTSIETTSKYQELLDTYDAQIQEHIEKHPLTESEQLHKLIGRREAIQKLIEKNNILLYTKALKDLNMKNRI